jgi:hypothetical protein
VEIGGTSHVEADRVARLDRQGVVAIVLDLARVGREQAARVAEVNGAGSPVRCLRGDERRAPEAPAG